MQQPARPGPGPAVMSSRCSPAGGNLNAGCRGGNCRGLGDFSTRSSCSVATSRWSVTVPEHFNIMRRRAGLLCRQVFENQLATSKNEDAVWWKISIVTPHDGDADRALDRRVRCCEKKEKGKLFCDRFNLAWYMIRLRFFVGNLSRLKGGPAIP